MHGTPPLQPSARMLVTNWGAPLEAHPAHSIAIWLPPLGIACPARQIDSDRNGVFALIIKAGQSSPTGSVRLPSSPSAAQMPQCTAAIRSLDSGVRFSCFRPGRLRRQTRYKMPAKLNHVAIASDQYPLNARFYESLFGMKTSSKPRPSRSVVVGDGYVGLNSIPRREGRCSGIDHFGIEVDDLDDTIARIKRFDAKLEAVKRPPVRPFAAWSAHDPDCNVFDLSQRNIDFQKDVYAELG